MRHGTMTAAALFFLAASARAQDDAPAPAAEAKPERAVPAEEPAAPADDAAAETPKPKKKRKVVPDLGAEAPKAATGNRTSDAGNLVKASLDAVAAKEVPGRLDSEELGTVARDFYEKLVRRDAEGVMAYCKTPFFFEGKSAGSTDDVRRRWSAAMNSRPVERYTLFGVDVLTPEQMEEKHGKAPAKLSAWALKGGMLTIGNLSGKAALVLWRKYGNTWSAVAYHD